MKCSVLYKLLALTISILLLCATSLAMAGTDSSQEKDTEFIFTKFYSTRISSFDIIKIGGSLEGSNYTYPISTPGTDIRSHNRLIFKLNVDGRLDDRVHVYAQMKVRSDLPQGNTRTRVIPQEAYLDVTLGDFGISGGYQIFSWGFADLMNPTDRLNPVDYSDLMDYEKEGIPALRLSFSHEKLLLEGIWMPIPDESELPDSDSRFFAPILASTNNPLLDIFHAPPGNYKFTIKALDPPIAWGSSQFGGRLFATLGRFDLGLSYFNGYEKRPYAEAIIGLPDPSTGEIPVTINEIFPREQVIGFNAATGFKGLNLKMESALVLPEKSSHDIGNADNNHFIYVIGGDYTFYELFGKHEFSINMEFMQEIHPSSDKKEYFGRLFERTLFSRLEYKFSEYFKILLYNAFNFDDHGYYIEPQIIWEPIDDLELKLKASIFDGPDTSLLGLFHDDKRINTSIKYSF